MKNTTHKENIVIPVFLASDENYAPFLCTTIYSILENTQSTIEFYVLDGGILENTKVQIKDSLKSFTHFSLEYIDMSTFDLKRFPSIKHYSINAYSRYFIPDIKPELKKVLYLDIDIIVEGDIAELYNQNLENYPLGAILEDFYPHNYTYLKETLHPAYNGGSKYFNSGVLLIDSEYWREHNIPQKLVDLTFEKLALLERANQDVFNITFENNFKVIDYIYNYMPDHYDYIEKLHPERAEEICKNAKIIHFTAGKPWENLSIVSYKFWEVLKKTLFYEKILFNNLTSKNELTLQKKLLTELTLKQEFSYVKYYRYKILRKLMWGRTRKKYKEKYRELKNLKRILFKKS